MAAGRRFLELLWRLRHEPWENTGDAFLSIIRPQYYFYDMPYKPTVTLNISIMVGRWRKCKLHFGYWRSGTRYVWSACGASWAFRHHMKMKMTTHFHPYLHIASLHTMLWSNRRPIKLKKGSWFPIPNLFDWKVPTIGVHHLVKKKLSSLNSTPVGAVVLIQCY